MYRLGIGILVVAGLTCTGCKSVKLTKEDARAIKEARACLYNRKLRETGEPTQTKNTKQLTDLLKRADAAKCGENDCDCDGIPDSEDACPTCPEDVDGRCGTDGCPDIKDSCPGTVDKCVKEKDAKRGEDYQCPW